MIGFEKPNDPTGPWREMRSAMAPSDTPTPLPPVPRGVRFRLGRSLGLWGGRLFILPHTLIGIGLLLNLPWTLIWAFAGSEIPATVTRGEPHTSKGKTSYTLYYRYQVGGRTFEGSDGVPKAVYDRYSGPLSLERTEKLTTVRYFALGSIRKVAMVEAVSPAREFFTLLGIGCFWNGVLSVFLYQLYWVPWRTRWLVRWGQAVTGKITGHREHGGRSAHLVVQFEFINPDTGLTVPGKMSVLERKLWPEAVVGKPVTVLFRSRRPQTSIVYEFSPYQVVE